MGAEISRSTSTVTVICRMPFGLVLDLYDAKALHERNKAAMSVGAPIPEKSVRLRGARTDPRFHRRENMMLGMGGRTRVDKDFWDAWCAQNSNFAPLTAGLIFAEATEESALSKLAERRNDRTGFEGCTEEQLKKAGVTRLNEDDD
jgi:hypothetical protein